MPAHPTTVSLRSDAAEAQRQDPIVANDQARKTLRQKPSSILSC
jgi:hypothetical protein